VKTRKGFPKHSLGLFFLIILTPLLFSDQESIWENPPQKKVLPNGLAVVFQKDTSSPLTVFHIVIKGGKAAQPEGLDGLAYMTTRLLLEIPERRRIQDMMVQGSAVSLLCKMEYTRINITCLSENLEETLETITRISFKPLFSGLRIQNVKNHMNYLRRREEDDLKTVGHQTHIEKFFENTVLGGPVLGRKESLDRITKKDIQSFYRNYFVANNVLLVVCTDLEEENLMRIIENYFGKFPTGKAPDIERIYPTIPQERKIFIPRDTKQSLVSCAFPLPELTQKSFTLAFMLENLLGAGVDSKLWPLRGKKKLAYEINAKATLMRTGGFLEAYLETDNIRSEAALSELKKIFQDLFEKGITEEELQATKINSRTHFIRGNETKEVRVQNFDFYEASGLGVDFASAFLQEIDEITLDEINAYIKDVLSPEKRAMLVVGSEMDPNSNP
jgi:predicted Zn-dependent peptidase